MTELQSTTTSVGRDENLEDLRLILQLPSIHVDSLYFYLNEYRWTIEEALKTQRKAAAYLNTHVLRDSETIWLNKVISVFENYISSKEFPLNSNNLSINHENYLNQMGGEYEAGEEA